MDKKADSENLLKPMSDLSVITEDEKSFKGVIRWSIPILEVEKRYNKVEKFIRSDTFSIGSPSYCSFHFLLYPSGKNKTFENNVSACISFSKKPPESAFIKCDLYLDGIKSKNVLSTSGAATDGRIDFDDLCNVSDLKYYTDRCKNDLTVRCTLKIKVREVKCVFDKTTVYSNARDYDLCKESFKRNLFSDVILSVEEHEIKTHKALLAQIPYFEELFRVHESKERFELTNIKRNILEHVLDFLYTNEVPQLNFKLACQLYIVASDLKIFDLKNLCSAYLGANVTETNIFIVLKLSHEFEDGDLKKECIKFIKNSDTESLTENSVVL